MNFNDEMGTINSLDDYELIKYLENGLVSRATGGNFEYYKSLFDEIGDGK